MLERLVNTDSATKNRPGVNHTAGLVAGELIRIGFDVEQVPAPPPFGNQVVGKLGSPPFEVLLVGHIDTALPPGSAQLYPFKSEGDKSYGVGVLDMKGGVVCAIAAVETLLKARPEASGIAVLFNSDEEDGSPHSRQVLRQLADESRRAFILEPGRDRQAVVGSRKAVGIFKISVAGVASHAGSEPEAGASAVHDLVALASSCLSFADDSAGTTVNVGVIQGGTEPYIVAESARMKIDVRASSKEEMTRVDEGFKKLIELPADAGIRRELTGGFHRPPMERTEGNVELFREAREAGQLIGLDLTMDENRGGASDGNLTSFWAVPTLDGLGPSGSGAHSNREFIYTDTLFDRIALLALLLDRFTV